ncbi:MAG: glycosyltransferase [Cyanobacteriota bacterium]|nr:glycosyltransferase [Cyanobacteriota bacterium]
MKQNSQPPKVGYILKMYPRFSETFIVSEILALEKQGMQLEIFSLRAPVDGRFHATLGQVQAHVSYISSYPLRANDLWTLIHQAAAELPEIWSTLAGLATEEARDVYQAIQIALLAKRSGIQHFHAHFASVATQVARIAARLLNISYSFTCHAKDIFHESVDFNRFQSAVDDASHVITISEYNQNFLTQKLSVNNNRVHHVYNGLDLETYQYQPHDSSHQHVTAVGRLVEKKGFADLLQACHLLRQRGVDLPVRLIGSGPLEASLRQQVAELKLDDLVTLLGPRTHGEIIEEVSSAAMFVAPCRIASDGNRDGLPTVLLEAMALGTPCISTDVTGIPEVIIHEQTGLLVEQANAEALAAAMLRLLHSQQEASTLARNGRALIEKSFDVNANAESLIALYQRAAQRQEVSQR